MPDTPPPPCVVCDATSWIPLATPGGRSMASDWRPLDRPLRKYGCARCGAIRGDDPGDGTGTFAHGYRLYAHPPGATSAERRRQQQYARWIASALPGAPASVLDVGCGNGSLLLALRDVWAPTIPAATYAGCDLSPDGVAFGRAAGLTLWVGTAADLPPAVTADLVVSVNVIEHTDNPRAFLAALRARVRPGGQLVVVCPDGDSADVDLLVADHQHSFGAAHLRALLAQAGCPPRAHATAPPTLGSFQLAVAVPTTSPGDSRFDGHGSPHSGADGAAAGPATAAVWPGARATVDAAGRLLERWRALDEALSLRLGDGDITAFGAGEAAGLLRAYAPRTWVRVTGCAIDAPAAGDTFGSLPVVPIASVPAERTVLVAVRALDQPAVAARLRARGHRVVTWYDLAGGEHA